MLNFINKMTILKCEMLLTNSSKNLTCKTISERLHRKNLGKTAVNLCPTSVYSLSLNNRLGQVNLG